MPQLDTLSYFTQYVYLLLSFLSTYYFVITFILPSTLTAGKLRAKFKGHLENSKASPNELSEGNQAFDETKTPKVLSDLTDSAFKLLSHKSVASSAVEGFNSVFKSGKYSVKSAFLLHTSNVLANKKRLVESCISKV